MAVSLNVDGVIASTKLLCAGPGCIWMGDCVWVQLTEIYLGLTNHPGQLSLAIPPWVGEMSTGDGFWPPPGKKRRVLRGNVGPRPAYSPCHTLDHAAEGCG